MSEETKKPVTGSNEHFAEIETKLATLEDLRTRFAAVSDSYHALVAESSRLSSKVSSLEGTVSTLQTTVANLQSTVNELQRVNPAG